MNKMEISHFLTKVKKLVSDLEETPYSPYAKDILAGVDSINLLITVKQKMIVDEKDELTAAYQGVVEDLADNTLTLCNVEWEFDDETNKTGKYSIDADSLRLIALDIIEAIAYEH